MSSDPGGSWPHPGEDAAPKAQTTHQPGEHLGAEQAASWKQLLGGTETTNRNGFNSESARILLSWSTEIF